ncbi:MAG TPA: tripartite tricarboxylate transporter substrate binding protein [Xanthobacteraceae bacterium]|jgi:tripartite-type tricarboxylate transporter receptor subunit TctC|nr:tripartite tricarboxylate transporter substrate binding protein [Xanthobacteraceae bacterium]
MSRRLPFIASGLTALTLVAAAAAALAQSGAAGYPDHPIKVIVPVPAGGGVDTISRLVTGKMRDSVGQPFIVDNKGGVGGSVGAEVVFNSAPDGYTILASQPSPITTNAFLYKSLNYDPAQLTPIAIMSHVPNVLLVRADLPVKNVAEFIAYAKANPGKLNYASQGIGTTSHLTAELFQTLTHTKLTHVPYKGTAPAVADLLAGNVDLMFNELATSIELHKAGRARILAVTVQKRVEGLPDIPTLEEAGVTGCVSDTWHALTAPPKTPADIIAKLNAAANTALRSTEVLDRFHQLNITAAGGTPEEAGAFIKSETARWGQVIRDAGIKPE